MAIGGKNSNPGFRDLITSIKKGEYAPVYILMGEEAYYIDRIVELLENTVIAEEEKDFNQIVFYGSDAEISKVVGSAQQFPVMAEKQLILLKESQTMFNAKSQLEKLTGYINHPNPSTILAITYKGDSLPSTHPLIKSAHKGNSVVFNSDKLKDYQLSTPIKDYCQEKQVGIDDKSISLLVDYIGGPLNKIFGEIDKLILAEKGNLKQISPDLIEKYIGISKDYNTFELTDALAHKDYTKSMLILTRFACNTKQNPGVMVISVIFNYFSKLLLALLAKDKSDQFLLKELDLKNSYALKGYREGMSRYNARSVWKIIHSIRECDAKSKGIGSTQDEYDLIKELIFRIFTL